MSPRSRPGYVFLLTVLVIGVIAGEMVLSLSLLGLAGEQSSLTVQQSAQAYAYAQTCTERALRELRLDLSYDGGVTVPFTDGSCTISHTGGAGNADRALCILGQSGKDMRQFELQISQIYPRLRIASWREVGTFSLCP